MNLILDSVVIQMQQSVFKCKSIFIKRKFVFVNCSFEFSDQFLRTIPVPQEFCAFKSNANCEGLIQYRTLSGVCNNLQRPYQGSSQTAFGRLLPAAYDDGKVFFKQEKKRKNISVL